MELGKRTLQTNQAILIAEKRLLNSLYNNTELLNTQGLDKEVFLHATSKSIYFAIEKLHSMDVKPTKEAVLQYASDIDLYVDGAIIEGILTDSSEDIDVVSTVSILREGKRRLESIGKLNDAITQLNTLPLTAESEELNKVKDSISEADVLLANDDFNVKTVYDMEGWLDNYQEATANRVNGEQFPFYNFMFDALVVDGAAPGQIGCVAAASGSGKSTIALSLLNSLVNMNVPTMLFSLEMALTPTADRFLANRLEIPYTEMVRPEDPQTFDAIRARVAQEAELLKANKNFRISEDASLSLSDLRKEVKKFQNDIGSSYAIVIIDLLSMVQEFTSASGANTPQVIENAMNKLSALAKELQIHVIGIVQLNRSNESDKANTLSDLEKFRPQRNQIKNANAFLERARYTLSAFRKKFWAEQYLDKEEWEDMEDIIELSVLKQNNGPLKRVSGLFNGATFSITPIENSLEDED